ncbi:glycosyltransferase [Candidatus Binatia bacterium]|nr:glycosyltransferase [Candidatus Binatia bacterium]
MPAGDALHAVRATIIVPSFNHAAWVEEAVASALAQTERDVEVVVIDDGSTDDSLVRLARLDDDRLDVVSQPNAGLSTTLDRGLARARGRWVKFLPSDDALHPECIARQLAAADAAPGARLVFALPTVVDAAGAPLSDPAPQAWFDHTPEGRDAILRDLLERNFLCAPAVLFDRDLARLVGGFDPGLRIAQDYDLWLKMLPWAPATFVRERLVRVRWHGANQSGVVTAASEGERARVVRRSLDGFGLERWVDLFRARDDDGASSASAALADALTRSGLHELAPLAARLRALRDDAHQGEGIRRLAGRIGRLLRPAVPLSPGATPPVIETSPRVERWIVVAARATTASRAGALATVLAHDGVSVTLAGSTPIATVPGVTLASCDLATLRTLLGTRDERVRLVVQEPDAAVIAFAREARLAGVRVIYDKAPGVAAFARAGIDSERALIDAADDLVGDRRDTVKQLATARRLVHLLPEPTGVEGAAERSRALRAIAARPTVAVVVSCSRVHEPSEVEACLAGLESARDELPYRIVVVDDGVRDDVLDVLVARDDAGAIQLLRNALRGRVSGRNLALRATASELVVLLDADRRVAGPGWLEPPVAALLEETRLGAVVERGRDGGTGWAWLAPRRLLQHLSGFDEAYDPQGLEDLDLQHRLRSAGYRVAHWQELAVAPIPTRGRSVVDPTALQRASRRFVRRFPDVPLPRDWSRFAEQV